MPWWGVTLIVLGAVAVVGVLALLGLLAYKLAKAFSEWGQS